MLHVAVIGVGSMGQNHARVYRNMDDVRLVGVVDENLSQANRIGARYGVPSYGSAEELFREHRVDLVSLVVPTDKHYEIGIQVIQKGIHLLVEKPIAQTVEQGEEMIRLANEYGTLFAVGHLERFNPVVVELYRRLRRGEAGPIYKICTQRLSPYPPRIKDVGVVIDLATHDINLLPYLMEDSIIHLHSETHRSINTSNEKEDLFHGVLRFSNGAVGVLDVDWMTPRKVRRVVVTGARGLFECDLISQELVFFENGSAPGSWTELSVLRGVTEGDTHGVHIHRQEPLVLELEDFVAAVKERRSPLVTGEDGLNTLRLAMRFLEAADSGCEIVFGR